MNEPLPPDRAVRLLRAKAAELEGWLAVEPEPGPLDYLAADVALIATMLADHIEHPVTPS